MRVTDLKIVSVATADADAAAATFRDNFALPITRRSVGATARSLFLAIGAAEIEMMSPAVDRSPLAADLAARGAGLHALVLEVDDLDEARATLAGHGIDVSVETGPDERPSVRLDPAQTHGVRITLIGR
jgi:catechol 2,3-dioxygenase-like lactoylglutathione lyase family enzyme